MLIVVIVIGLLYALPNLFGEDPAVQITGARGVAASEQTLIQVQKTLQEEKITNVLDYVEPRYKFEEILHDKDVYDVDVDFDELDNMNKE